MKKNISLSLLMLLIFVSCQDKSKNYFTEVSPEIDTMRQMIEDYETGNWESYMSHFTKDAKIYHNRVNSYSRTIVEAVEDHKAFINQVTNYQYSTTENQTVEMIIDSKGTTWVSFWGVWTGTFTESGNDTEIIVHITSRFVDGKINQEHMYWDTAPFLLEKIWVENRSPLTPEVNPAQ